MEHQKSLKQCDSLVASLQAHEEEVFMLQQANQILQQEQVQLHVETLQSVRQRTEEIKGMEETKNMLLHQLKSFQIKVEELQQEHESAWTLLQAQHQQDIHEQDQVLLKVIRDKSDLQERYQRLKETLAEEKRSARVQNRQLQQRIEVLTEDANQDTFQRSIHVQALQIKLQSSQESHQRLLEETKASDLEKNSQITTLGHENHRLMTLVSSMETESKILQESYQRIRMERTAAEERCIRLTREKKEEAVQWTERLSSLEQELELANESNQQLVQDKEAAEKRRLDLVREWSDKNKTLKEELESLEHQVKSMEEIQKSTAEAKEALEEMMGALMDVEEENKSLTEELESMRADKEQFQTKMASIEEELESLKPTNLRLFEELKKQDAEMDALENEIAALREENDRLAESSNINDEQLLEEHNDLKEHVQMLEKLTLRLVADIRKSPMNDHGIITDDLLRALGEDLGSSMGEPSDNDSQEEASFYQEEDRGVGLNDDAWEAESQIAKSLAIFDASNENATEREMVDHELLQEHNELKEHVQLLERLTLRLVADIQESSMDHNEIIGHDLLRVLGMGEPKDDDGREDDSMSQHDRGLDLQEGDSESREKQQPQTVLNSLGKDASEEGSLASRRALEDEIKELERSHDDANHRLEEAIAGSERLKTEINYLSDQLEQQQEEMDSVMAENQSLRGEKGRLEGEIETLSSELQGAVEREAANREEAENVNATLSSEIEAKQEELSSVLDEKQRLERDKGRLEDDIATLSLQLQEAAERETERREETKGLIADLYSEIEANQGELTSMLAEKSDIETLSSKLEGTADQEAARREEAERLAEDLSRQIEAKHNELAAIVAENQQLINAKATIEVDVSRLKADLASAAESSEQIEQLKEQLEAQQIEIDRHVAEKRSLFDRKTELEAAALKLPGVRETNRTSESPELSNRQMETLIMQIERQQNIIDSEKAEVQRLLDEKASVAAQAEKLRMELSARDSERESYLHQQATLHQLYSNIEKLEAEKQRLVEELGVRESEVQSAKSREVAILKETNQVTETLSKVVSNKDREIAEMGVEIQRLIETKRHQDFTARLDSRRDEELSRELQIAKEKLLALTRDLEQQSEAKVQAQNQVRYQQQTVQSLKAEMEQMKRRNYDEIQAANKLNEDLWGKLLAEKSAKGEAWRGHQGASFSTQHEEPGVRVLNDEIYRLRSENQRLQEKIFEVSNVTPDRAEVGYLNAEILSLKSENQRLQQSVSNARYKEADTEILQREIASLKNENQRLLDSRTAIEEQLDEQKQLAAKFKSDLDVANRQKEVRFDTPDRHSEQLEEKLAERNQEIAKLRKENQQLSSDQKKMRKAIREQTSIVQSLKADLEGEVEEELKTLIEENERLQEERDSLEEELSEQTELVDQLRLDLMQAKRSELKSLEEETDDQDWRISDQLELKDREIAELRAENKRLADGQVEATKRIESQRAEVEQLKADLEDEIEQELDSLKKLQARNNSLEEQLAALKKENSELALKNSHLRVGDQSHTTFEDDLRMQETQGDEASSDLKGVESRSVSAGRASRNSNETLVQQLEDAREEIARTQLENQRLLREKQKEAKQTAQLQKDLEQVFYQASEKEKKLREEKAALEESLQDRLRNLKPRSIFPF
eukprot:scaffold1704_cov105-Cylindrotheca_fusiformis.AAC.1